MAQSASAIQDARAASVRADEARREAERATRAAVASLPIPGAYQSFAPKVKDYLVVQLPGETMRVPVTRVISPDAVLVRLDAVPMAKSHNFRFEDTIGVRRRIRNGRDVWEAQNDREFLAEQARLTPPAPQKIVGKKAAAKPVTRGKKGRSA